MKPVWGRIGVFVAVTLVVAACIDLSTDPDEIVAIEFTNLPWPSVVAGDTLRDSSGKVVPLVARLFNGNGDEVTVDQIFVEFLPEKSTVRIISGNFLVADDTASGSVGIIATADGLQSVPRPINIVAAPDSMAANGTITPLAWVVPDVPAQNTSQPLGVRVFSTGGTTPTGVSSWIVRFTLEAGGRQIPESDTTQIFLVGDAGQPSYTDTTDTQGAASRRVRLRIPPGSVPPDSAVITMTASYRGVPLIGSPVRLVLPLRPG